MLGWLTALPLSWSLFGYQEFEIWIMVIGSLVCATCGIIGCFLVLKKLALMGDAISHAILPGIVVAVMLTGSLSSPWIVLGALVLGLLTPLLVDTIHRTGRVQEDVSIGSVFTVFFAIGVVMVSNVGNVDVDADCVLYGEIALAPFDTWIVGATPALDGHGPSHGGVDLGPRSVWLLGSVLLFNLLLIVTLFKELKLTTFDEGLAEAMGMRPRVIHYLLMAAVAMTTVGSFESVGAILVVAMLIAPGATAYLLTDSLKMMLFLAGGIGVACAIFGYQMALALGGEVSIAGCMATVAGTLFVAAVTLSPRYGLVVRSIKRLQLARRLVLDHLLVGLYRATEDEAAAVAAGPFIDKHFPRRARAHGGLRNLIKRGLVGETGSGLIELSAEGREAARALLRGHRLWETYLHERVGLQPDHVHSAADRVEHFLSDDIQQELYETLQHPETDPHGRPIPRPESEPQ